MIIAVIAPLGTKGGMWARLDDAFPDHPKVATAGPLAGWLHVCALCYANRYLTDGFIPAGQVRKLADVDDAFALAGRLVAAGLWESVEGGYLIHDFLEYNVSRADELARREAKHTARVEAGRAGGVRSGESRRSTSNEANDQAQPKQTPKQTPKQADSTTEANTKQKRTPVPVPLRSTRATNQISVNGTALGAANAAAGGQVELPDLWTARYATVVGHAATGAELETLRAVCRDGLALDSIELGEALSEALATENCRSPAGLARTILQRWRGDGSHLAPQWTDSNVPPSRRTET